MKQPGRAPFAALVIAIAMLLLAGAFVWFRLTSPFDFRPLGHSSSCAVPVTGQPVSSSFCGPAWWRVLSSGRVDSR
jgi:hypothetical protein